MTPRNMPPHKNRFKKGKSGNPQGRPKKFEKETLPLIITLAMLINKASQKDSRAVENLNKIKRILLKYKPEGKNEESLQK